MDYGQLSPNTGINAVICRCLDLICGEDRRKFIKKFGEQSRYENQAMGTFWELLLGAYLAANGRRMRYELPIGPELPDWSILNEALEISGIVEVADFHADIRTESEMERQLQTRGTAYVWAPPNDNRLYHCIWRKASSYKALVQELNIPYVISVHSGFRAAIDAEELDTCLFDDVTGLFSQYPDVSGIMLFEDTSSGFHFRYTQNPYAPRAIELPSGVFLD